MKAMVSLKRIEMFLGRSDIEGQPMNTSVGGGIAGGDMEGRARAPVGGLLVQSGTFTWPVSVVGRRSLWLLFSP